MLNSQVPILDIKPSPDMVFQVAIRIYSVLQFMQI